MSKISFKPGRCTLTITCSPVIFSFARCTCPSDAAASALSENSSYTSPSGRPSSSSTICLARLVGNGGTRSCSFSSSVMNGLLRTSTRVENCWPILMNVGPSLSRPSLSQLASRSVRSSFFASVNPPLYVNLSSSPTRRITNANTNDQISIVRTNVPTDLRRSKFRGGSETLASSFSSFVVSFFASAAFGSLAGAATTAAAAGAAAAGAAAGASDGRASSSAETISTLHSSSCGKRSRGKQTGATSARDRGEAGDARANGRARERRRL